ncbi:probable pectinesterase 29 [Salvia miltiorrhiza]|uniref:probable pectinesterase 29 n=1 Tax=Salvia miltiorrhiza TaxID=226208 RepID=UPI0025ACEA64|nr:probable pectinesterase 29 [Salvia miltiorrhiza]
MQLVSKTISVDPLGRGGFRSIQAAINSVPSNNKIWIQINIGRGVYREKVKIPSDKPYIYLKGAGMTNTVIEWNDHGSIDTSPTFDSQAHHTIARGIKFVNSYNSPPNGNRNPVERAVAARIQGDKSALYECGFFGLQDTLWDVEGRHYYKNCMIEGAIDFIFGTAQSLYEGCSISVAAGGLKGSKGYITAQGRVNPGDSNGFVFKQCKIFGSGQAFLGRPWRNYARVVFYETQMSEVVVPQGWYIWNSGGHEGQLTLSEYNSHGQGANIRERVEWAKNLTAKEANTLASVSFIDEEGSWMNQVLSIFDA